MKFIAVAILILSTFSPAFAADEQSASPALMVHILDYLAKDYGGAVRDHKVISQQEFAEQSEFAKNAAEMYPKLPHTATTELTQKLVALQGLIAAKEDPATVTDAAHEIRDAIIREYEIATAPAHAVDLVRGRQLFTQNCASCHGTEGGGDGVAGAHLDPKPANFRDKEGMKEVSPLTAFNAIRLGVSGTAMAPFKSFSDDDTWNLSYFVLTFSGKNPPSPPSPPPGGKSDTDVIQIARDQLHEAEAEYRKGHFVEAHNQAISAYLEGFEAAEPKLRAKNDALVTETEERMLRVRQVIDAKEPADNVTNAIRSAEEKLQEASALMSNGSLSPWAAFMAASVILLREGFEAALLIVAFLGVIRASGAKGATRWIHFGWTSALGLGVVAWFLSGWLVGISGVQREMAEGLTAFFAVGVLLFVGFWLHRQTEVGRWKEFVESRVHTAMADKSRAGLFMIAFVAVFREALETVLFLQTIWIDGTQSARMAMLAGMVASFAAVLSLAWAILHYSVRVPIRKIFSATSVMMAALALILLGKGLHSLQETGWLKTTPFPASLSVDLIGLYPTWETFAAQIVLLAVIVSILWKSPTTAKKASIGQN